MSTQRQLSYTAATLAFLSLLVDVDTLQRGFRRRVSPGSDGRVKEEEETEREPRPAWSTAGAAAAVCLLHTTQVIAGANLMPLL